jgi:hypothetical protein
VGKGGSYEDTVDGKEDGMKERATELEYLQWFRGIVDFGPAHSDVIDMYNEDFMRLSGKNLPEGWNIGQDGETNLDK